MTDPTGDGYNRYRPQPEQPTQPMQPVQQQPTQAMPLAQGQPTQTMPLQQPTQQFGQVPFQGPAQQPVNVAEPPNMAPPVGPNGQKHGQNGKKPWYKRPWVWIIVAIVIISGLAFGQGGSKDASAPASSKSTQSAVSQPSKETFDMQTLVGKKWDEASQTLTDHHWTSTDYTVQTDDGKTPILGGNWTVTSVSADAKPVISLKHDTAQAAPAAPKADPGVPPEYSSALSKAGSYSSMMHMSRQGIYDQLTSEYGEKFSPEAAQYAVDHLQADYNANALAKAKDYQKTMNMSPEAIRDQLTSQYGEKFTPDEANYAVQHLND